MAKIPNSHRGLLEGPVFVTLVTTMPDGQPQASPVWALLDGDDIIINTAVGRQKDKNLQNNPKTTLVAINPDNPYSYLEVRGEVADRIEDDEQTIDQMAKLYTGNDKYYGTVTPEDQREVRVTYRIRPKKVIAN
ncbi:MAG: PPOX class F420-dependent enzyme [Anaerolineaceae bacterium]|nr:PPOX class F420-dependent enzyme [Anaerolineaceae bacterium]